MEDKYKLYNIEIDSQYFNIAKERIEHKGDTL